MSPVNLNKDKWLEEVLGLSSDPVLRRTWLLYVAQQALPFVQAIEWARIAERFLTGPTAPELSREISTRSGPNPSSVSPRSRRSTGTRGTLLQLIKDNPEGLSRGNILEFLHVKGNKAAETSVSNALHALIKRNEVVRRERKYWVVQDRAPQ
jgi:hypothetical protein